MRWLLELLRALIRNRPSGMVRPWALSAPILVLLLTVPLLRPVRQSDPRYISDDELATLATTQSLVEYNTLSIDRSTFRETSKKFRVAAGPGGVGRWYADQPPALALLLSGPYRLMHRAGITFAADGPVVLFLLTMLGSALPAACAAGLVYRMGRLFELPRPWRALLALSAVLATGLGSYATVINPHVPAGTLVLAAAACLVHLAIAVKPPLTLVWLFCSGFCVATAAIIDPSALPFVLVMAGVTLGFRGKGPRRLGRLLVFALGVAPPLAAHLACTVGVTGDAYQGVGFRPAARLDATTTAPAEPLDEEPRSLIGSIGQVVAGVTSALLGRHGLLSHFPILALGAAGVFMVMHRHWPPAAKVLAAGTLAAAVFLVVAYTVHRPDRADWRDAMFASRWFVVFGPLLMVWSGAWARRPHGPIAWTVAGVLLAFSGAVGLIGATDPWPRQGYAGYSAVEAAERLWRAPGPTENRVGGDREPTNR